jgi:hypothetical protein
MHRSEETEIFEMRRSITFVAVTTIITIKITIITNVLTSECDGATRLHARRTTYQGENAPSGLGHFITDCSCTLSGACRAAHSDGTPIGGPITLSCVDSVASACILNPALCSGHRAIFSPRVSPVLQLSTPYRLGLQSE